MRASSLLAVVLLILLYGSLGLRTVPECDSDPKITQNSMLINCYHTAAITQAYLCGQGTDCQPALDICNTILTKFSPTTDPDGSDLMKKAELISNLCYYDVARITANNVTCQYIQQHADWKTNLFGAQVTQDACVDDATRLATLNQANFHNNNMCSPLFILGMIGFAAIYKRRN